METKLYFREFLKYSSLNVLGMIALSCYILAEYRRRWGPTGWRR